MIVASKKDVEEILESLRKYHELGAQLPQLYVKTVVDSIRHGYKAATLEFFKRLPERAPNYVYLFIEAFEKADEKADQSE